MSSKHIIIIHGFLYELGEALEKENLAELRRVLAGMDEDLYCYIKGFDEKISEEDLSPFNDLERYVAQNLRQIIPCPRYDPENLDLDEIEECFLDYPYLIKKFYIERVDVENQEVLLREAFGLHMEIASTAFEFYIIGDGTQALKIEEDGLNPIKNMNKKFLKTTLKRKV